MLISGMFGCENINTQDKEFPENVTDKQKENWSESNEYFLSPQFYCTQGQFKRCKL
jgi:hypothetical protein